MTTLFLDEGDFEIRTRCPFCGGAGRVAGPDAPLFPTSEHCAAGLVTVTTDIARARRLMRCETCTGRYCSHIPTEEATQRINDAPSYLTNLEPDPTRLSFKRGWAALSERFPSAGGAVLDIGACGGDFLRPLTGWRRSAMEPSLSSAAALAFTDRVIEGALDGPVRPELAPQDVVTLFDVVEHFRAPRLAFERLAALVKPGGVLLIESGDAESRPARANALWSYVRYLSHFSFFTRRALAMVLEATGFELIEYRAVFHSRATLGQYLRLMPRALLYAGVSGFGRAPQRWVSLGARFGRAASAPSLPSRDHFFAVAKRRLSR